jgi:hypothetical protein
MTEYGESVNAILAKGASQWTAKESKLIEGLIKDGHRAGLKAAMLAVRGGEKPQNINIQKPAS